MNHPLAVKKKPKTKKLLYEVSLCVSSGNREDIKNVLAWIEILSAGPSCSTSSATSLTHQTSCVFSVEKWRRMAPMGVHMSDPLESDMCYVSANSAPCVIPCLVIYHINMLMDTYFVL